MHLQTIVYLAVMVALGQSSKISPEMMREVKSALLPLFGIKDRPRITGIVQIPDALKEMYQIQMDSELDSASIPLPGLHTQSANTIRSFIHMESPIDGRFHKHENKFRLKFDVDLPKLEQLKAAELKLTSASAGVNKNFRILVKDIIKPGIKRVDGPITRVIDSKIVNGNSTISLDVFPAVQRWIQNRKHNYGLLVVVSGGDKTRTVRLKRDVNENDAIWAAKQPVLLTYTDDGKNKQRTGKDMLQIRSKRAVRRGHRKGDRDPCRRRAMYVNFRDVGWSDWIVAPLGYDAFYCDGECDYPMPEHMNTTNHAIVQSLMNSVRPTEVPKPCCVPTQLSSMSMLYVDSVNKVILKNYKEMVVIGCGCR